VFDGGALLKTYVDLRRVTEYNTGSNLDPRKMQNGYALINGRVSLSTPDERWTIELWGRNLTDERYAQITFDAPLQGDSPQVNPLGGGAFGPRTINSQLNAFVGEPQMYGITIRWAH
jgi:iron complex outermembrane recepter protein